MSNEIKKFYGNPLIGTWETEGEDGLYIFPLQLKEREAEFDWRMHKGRLWPHLMDGTPLDYDEAE